MNRAGIPRDSIHVFVGRSPNIGNGTTMFARYHYLKWGAYEHTALIGYTEMPPRFTHVFLLHDTCEVGEQFPYRVAHGLQFASVDVVAVNNGMCGFSLYRDAYLRSRTEELHALKDCDKHTAMLHEGFLVRGKGQIAEYPGKPYEQLGMEDIYGTGTPRLKEYYPQVDMWKYKANYGNTQPKNYIEVL